MDLEVLLQKLINCICNSKIFHIYITNKKEINKNGNDDFDKITFDADLMVENILIDKKGHVKINNYEIKHC